MPPPRSPHPTDPAPYPSRRMATPLRSYNRYIPPTPQSNSSLPSCHYPLAAAESSSPPSSTKEESKFNDDGNNANTNSDVSDEKENNIQYSPKLDYMKAKLQQRRLRRNDGDKKNDNIRLRRNSNKNKNDNIRSILRGYNSREEGGFNNINKIDRKFVNKADTDHDRKSSESKRGRSDENIDNESISKRYKIDLVPRIANTNHRVLKEINVPTNNNMRNKAAVAADISTKSISSSTSMANSNASSRALTTARERMAMAKQQHHHHHQRTTDVAQKCLSIGLQIMKSRSSDSNSEVTTSSSSNGSSSSSHVSSLEDPFIVRLRAKKLELRQSYEDGCGNVGKHNSSSTQSQIGDVDDISSSNDWLRVVQDSQSRLIETASSTFSISPMTKDSCSYNNGKRNYTQVEMHEAKCRQGVALSSPAQTIETQPTVGSYIGSIRLDSKGDEEQKMVVPQVIDHNKLCIDRVASELTDGPQKEKGTISYKNKLLPVKSPMPSIANSGANSYAASGVATDDTSADTNLFDMLRNTSLFHNGNKDECDDNSTDGEKSEELVGLDVTPKQPPCRPPLSPIPPTYDIKQNTKKKAVPKSSSKRRTNKSSLGMMTPNISPKVIRGTPCQTPNSNMSGSVMNSSIYDDENSCPNTPDPQLEYSFLANALLATSILPPQSTASKRSHQELNYASIGATARSTTTPVRRIDMSLGDEDTMTPHTCDDEFRPREKQCESNPSDQDKSDKIRNKINVEDVNILSIASALEDTSPHASESSSCERDNSQILLCNLKNQVKAFNDEFGPREKQCVSTNTTEHDKSDTTKENTEGATQKKTRGIVSFASALEEGSPNALESEFDNKEHLANQVKAFKDEFRPTVKNRASNAFEQDMIDKMNDDTNNTLEKPSHGILTNASVLEEDSSNALGGSSVIDNKEHQLFNLVNRVKALEERQQVLSSSSSSSSNSTSAAPSDEAAATESSASEIIKLRERVKWLEKVLGFGRGENPMYEDEIVQFKDKLGILERRLEEEMILKEEAIKTNITLTRDIEVTKDEHKRVEESSRRHIQDLEAELESDKIKLTEMKDASLAVEYELQQKLISLKSQLQEEKMKVEHALASNEAQQSVKDESKDAKLAKLKRANKELHRQQHLMEKELISCANGNNALRERLITIASSSTLKEQSHQTAYAQLKSLSEKYYHTKSTLKVEKEARRDEVSSLQYALDSMSRELLRMSSTVNDVQSEKYDLQNELKQQRLEKERTMTFCRGAHGG